MLGKRKPCAAAVAWTIGAGGGLAMLGSVPVLAADIKVEVTGSNIKRVEGEGALPVQTITARQIQEGGFQDTFELLQSISANQSFGSFNAAAGEGTTLVGFTGASLRGLGSQRTLVLLNGRRVAPYALANTTSPSSASVDLSSIPIAAIERVEVLKDGASAIYGTDAIAGVINFIVRQDRLGNVVRHWSAGIYQQTWDGVTRKSDAAPDRRIWDHDSHARTDGA